MSEIPIKVTGYVSKAGLLGLEQGFSASIVGPELMDENFNRPLYAIPNPHALRWDDADYLMSIIDAAIEDGFDPDEDGPLLDQIRANLKASRPPLHVLVIDDCPALHERHIDKGYPFGNRVPIMVRMVTGVHSDMPFATNARLSVDAGTVHRAWTNSYGAVSADLGDGKRLGLKPAEFEVISWLYIGHDK